MTPHGEEGHLNIYTKDQDSDVTGFGRHNRLIVFGDVKDSTVEIREDIRWDLPLSTEAQRKKVYLGWQRQHPKETTLRYIGSEQVSDSIYHDYQIVKRSK